VTHDKFGMSNARHRPVLKLVTTDMCWLDHG